MQHHFQNPSVCVIYNHNVYIMFVERRLDYIDLTGNENSWKRKIEDISNIYLHSVKQGEDILHPWLMICMAKFQDDTIDVIGTISERLPYTRLPGMNIFMLSYM